MSGRNRFAANVNRLLIFFSNQHLWRFCVHRFVPTKDTIAHSSPSDQSIKTNTYFFLYPAMTGFRVSEHRTWRRAGPSRPSKQRLEPPGPAREPAFHERLLTVPARVHDKIFGRLERRRPLFLTTRFVLVFLAALLILQGVSGSAQSSFEVGDYERVTEPKPVQAYLAPGSTHKFPIEVAVGKATTVSAFFTQDRAVVRLPSMGEHGNAYGLQIGVQHDQNAMDVALMVAQPGEGFRSVPATSKSGSATQFEAIRFAEAGEYGVLVRSTQGVGPAKIMVSIVEAPVEPNTPYTLQWLPLLSGAALATVLAGPYLPGAQHAHQPRGPKKGKDAPHPETVLSLGFAHMRPTRSGLDMEDGRGRSAERIASGHKRGWVIRVE